MAGKEEISDITKEIDADEGLKSKRKLLTIASLVLLAMSASGAKVTEANTFIFKIDFTNDKGLGVLLVLSVVFLMLRYYNYAVSYYKRLYELWSKRMLGDYYFYSVCEHTYDATGLVVDKSPKEIKPYIIPDESMGELEGSHEVGYEYKFPFVRNIRYDWWDRYADHERKVFVGLKNYPKVLQFEARYQLNSFITHRENLDILAPYLIGGLSVASFFFNEQFVAVVQWVAGL